MNVAHQPSGRVPGRRRWELAALRAATLAALVVDAAVHFHLAPGYDIVRATVSQGTLFRVEGAAALAAAVALLVRPGRVTWATAAAVLGGGVAAVVLYRYVDVGRLGPFPDMYEPLWYGLKTVSAVAEGLGALFAVVGLLLEPKHGRFNRQRLRTGSASPRQRGADAVDRGTVVIAPAPAQNHQDQ